MKWILAAVLSFSSLAQAQEQPFVPVPLPAFTDGLHTRYSANAIPDGALADALNVLLDEDVPGVVVARNGRAKYNSTAIPDAKTVRGIWPFAATDGTKYLVAFSSQSFFYSRGDGQWTEISTDEEYSASLEMDCVQALGKLYCLNGLNMFSWDGTSTSTLADLPIGSLIDTFRNRIVVAGVSGAKARIRMSAELDASDWTTNVFSSSPVNIAVGGVDDGLDVTCLMGVYQDVYIIGKRDSLWGLYGFDRDDFALREISREVGCIDDRSVREKNNCLYWMSQRGIEKWCGASINRISDAIRNQLDTIVASAGNPRSVIDTSQSDFEAGNLTASGVGAPISALISPGNIVASTWAFVDSTFSGDFANVSSDTGKILLAEAIPNSGFENGDRTHWTYTDYTTGNPINFLVHPLSGWGGGSFASNAIGNYLLVTEGCVHPNSGSEMDFIRMEILRASDNSTQATITYTNWDLFRCIPSYSNPRCPQTLDVSPYAFPIKIKLTNINGSVLGGGIDAGMNITSPAFSTGSVDGLLRYWIGSDGPAHGATGCAYPVLTPFMFDMDDPYYVPSGTFTSNGFYTGLSTPIYGSFTAIQSSGVITSIDSGGFQTFSTVTVDYYSATSSDGSNWDSWTTAVPGQQISSSAKGHVRYKAVLTTTPSTYTFCCSNIYRPHGMFTSTFSASGLSAGTTGYFISQCRNPSTSITSWGLFQCNTVSNGGSFSFAISTGASCNIVTRTTAAWTAQDNNQAISLTTAPYVAYRALFSLDSATQTPTLQDCTINWQEGTTRPPTASAVYRDRYYLSYTSSTASGQGSDHVLVLDKNDKWTLFDDHDCYSLSLYERKLYCGSSLNDGFVWRMDTGTDDGGSGFTSRIRTKAFSFGVAEKRKEYQKLYLELDPAAEASDNIDLTARYVLDRGTSTFDLQSIDLNEDPSHIPSAVFPFPVESPITSRYLQIELEASGLNQPWRLFGGKLYLRPLDAD